jgi:hypothetical protein
MYRLAQGAPTLASPMGLISCLPPGTMAPCTRMASSSRYKPRNRFDVAKGQTRESLAGTWLHEPVWAFHNQIHRGRVLRCALSRWTWIVGHLRLPLFRPLFRLPWLKCDASPPRKRLIWTSRHFLRKHKFHYSIETWLNSYDSWTLHM